MKEEMQGSPFALARSQGIHLDYCFLGEEIVGVYADLSGYQIVLNSSMDNDRQEDAMQMMIEHHNSKSRGMERCILKKELDRFYKFRAELSRLNKVVINALIMKKIQNEKT